MKRLRDEERALDDDERLARDAIAGIAPVGEASDAKRRVRERLRRSPPSLGSPRLGFALAIAVGGAVALTFALLHRRHAAAVAPASTSLRATPVAPVAPPTHDTATVAQPPSPVARDASTRPVVSATTNEDARRPASAARPVRPKPSTTSAASAVDPAAGVAARSVVPLETALVVDAIGALRRDHDPARAAMLLDFYLRKHPAGALVEEAMALAIEAALARGDGSALALADRYLARFPSGRYRPLARRARRER